MVMYKDPTEFRERFKRWKQGLPAYENGRPRAIQEVDKSNADFAKRLRSNWRQEIWDWEGSGKSVTHKIAGADNIVYPNVQTTKGGGLIDFTNPIWQGNVDPYERAIKNNDYVPMKTEEDAIWFGPNYKKYYPGFKDGKLPKYGEGKPKGDGQRYLWDDQTQSWTRYTGDTMGDVFADFVVTPIGGAHKKDIEHVQIVTPEQQQYSQRNKPTVSTNSTWHPTPAASTFAGRVVQAAGGDWKSADIASAGASLHPLLSVPIGVMDTGYNLNQSIHDISDTDQHVNTALSAASILPLVGGIKLLKGKDFGTKLLNSYNNYMYSLGNVDDINKTLRGIKYTDSAYDALPAMDDMFRDVAKDSYVKDQLKQYFARGVLSRPASAKGADIFTMKSPDQVYQGITDMQVPSDVRDIFYNSVLPRIQSYRPGYHGGILKPTVKSHVDQTLQRGYTTYPEKVFEDAGLKQFSGFEYPDGHIAVKDTDVDFALGHELRHRLDGTLNLTQGEQDLLNATFTQDFDDLPDFVETLRGVNMAPEKVTTNYDARLQLLGDYKLKNFSIEAQNKIIDAVSDDKIVNAIKNSNGYGRNYINFLVQQYGHVPSEIIKAARESMKRVGAVAGFGFLGATALKPRQKITE